MGWASSLLVIGWAAGLSVGGPAVKVLRPAQACTQAPEEGPEENTEKRLKKHFEQIQCGQRRSRIIYERILC
jgi:hypothetical protein